MLLPFLSLSFLFFSFLVVALVQRAALPTLRSAAAPLCCAGAAFCQPGEERNTLSLVKRNTMGLSQIKPCLVSRNGRQGNSDSRC